MLLRGRIAVSNSFAASVVRNFKVNRHTDHTHFKYSLFLMVWDVRIISGSSEHSCFSPLIQAAFHISSPGVRVFCGRAMGFGRALRSQEWRGNRNSSSLATKKKSHKTHIIYSRELKRGFTSFPSPDHRYLLQVCFFYTLKRRLNPLPHTRIQRVVYSLQETAGCLCRSISCHVGIYPVGLI